MSVVYVDGLRIEHMDELLKLSPEQIDRVEVDYTSMVSEGATTTGGVLRVFLRKAPQSGYTGSVDGALTFMPYYGISNAGGSLYLTGRWRGLTLRNFASGDQSLALSDSWQSIQAVGEGRAVESDEKYRNRYTNLYDRLTLSVALAPKHQIATSLLLRHDLYRPTYTTTELQSMQEAYISERNPTGIWQWLGKYSGAFSDRTSMDVSVDYYQRNYARRAVEQSSIYGASDYSRRTSMWRMRPCSARPSPISPCSP